MERLTHFLKIKIRDLERLRPDLDLSEALEKPSSLHPFNSFEYVIAHLLACGILSLAQYRALREDYQQRNKFLALYEITAPRTFGESWAQRHLREIAPALVKPSVELDADYRGQYDLLYQSIRIEVKASRAVRRQSGGTLISKALASDSAAGFDMNFQQLKPACCDVFVWMGVWRDRIRYWGLSQRDVAESPFYTARQHRGNRGEGQLWLDEKNIDQFARFEAREDNVLTCIKERFASLTESPELQALENADDSASVR